MSGHNGITKSKDAPRCIAPSIARSNAATTQAATDPPTIAIHAEFVRIGGSSEGCFATR
jgi:hypothetical protein